MMTNEGELLHLIGGLEVEVEKSTFTEDGIQEFCTFSSLRYQRWEQTPYPIRS